MEHMKNAIALLAAVSLLSPSLASAAWWNPVDWFNVRVNGVEEVSTAAADMPPSFEDEMPPQASNPIVGTRVETVYVDNPSLSLQVQALMQDNKELGEELARLRAALSNASSCKTDEATTATPDTKSEQDRLEKLESIDSDILDAIGYVLRFKPVGSDLSSKKTAINRALASYRIVDPKMSHPDLSLSPMYSQSSNTRSRTVAYGDAAYSDVSELKAYLEDYIRYR